MYHKSMTSDQLEAVIAEAERLEIEAENSWPGLSGRERIALVQKLSSARWAKPRAINEIRRRLAAMPGD